MVELEEEAGQWLANCPELDYMACGDTVESAKANFSDGLEATILLHGKLRQPHSCAVCRGRFVMPKFDWRFVDSEPQLHR